MDWFGRAKIGFTHPPSPLTLQKKNGTTTDLLKVCEEATPTCHLNPLLFNGHIQTMWTAVKEHGPHIYYRRRVFDADHKTYHGTFAVDFVVEPHQDVDAALPPRTAYFSQEDFAKMGSDDNKPMLICLHGLSGGSHEVYLRHAIVPLVESGEWEVCVINARGCANSSIASEVLFNARATWDLRQVREHVRLYTNINRSEKLMPKKAGEMAKGDVPKPPLVCCWVLTRRQHLNQCKSSNIMKLRIYSQLTFAEPTSTLVKKAPTVPSRAPSLSRTLLN